MSLRCKLFVLLNVAISSFAQNDVCKEGLYGDNCELTCSETCRPFQTFPCDKKSGQCSEGCKVGYFGDKCDKQCDCGSRVCYQATGECIESDETTASSTKHKSDNVGSTTEIPEQSRVCDGVWRVVGILLIVLTLVLGILLGIGIFFYVRRRTNQRTIKASDTSQRRFPGILFCFSGARDNGSKTGQEQVLLNDGNMQSSPVSTDVEAAELGENPKQTDQVAIGSSAGEKQARKSGKDIQHKGQLQQKQTENEEREKEKIIELIKQLSEQATENKELTKSNRDLNLVKTSCNILRYYI